MYVDFPVTPEPALPAAFAQGRHGQGGGEAHSVMLDRPLAGLAPDIAFLAAFGVSAATLLNAQHLAAHEGVYAHEAGLAHGLFSDDDYYRFLADHCGVPFCTSQVAFSDASQYPKILRDGIGRLAGMFAQGWLLAPRGQALFFVLANAAAMRQTGRFAIATPRHFSALAQHQFRPEMLDQASHDLPRLHPEYSAHYPVKDNARRLLQTLPGIVIAFALVFASAQAAAMAYTILGSLFLGAMWLRLSACIATPERHFQAGAPVRGSPMPRYSILVAMKDEADVAARLVSALAALDYPKSRLQVILILEEGDHATLAALNHLGLPPYFEILQAPFGQPRTKPRALNMALPQVQGEFLVVFDAEDLPHPMQLRAALQAFERAPRRTACLQAHLAIENHSDSWLTQLFAIEYAALFDVINPGLCQLGMPLPLGGSSNHFKVEALRETMGWDAWNVTEDADLGLRFARFGYDVETLASTTYEEAPVRLRAWLNQRARWQKGWMQTANVHLSRPWALVRQLGLARATGVSLMLAGMVLGPLLGPILFFHMLYRVALGQFLNPPSVIAAWLVAFNSLVAICGTFAVLVPAMLGIRRRRLGAIAAAVLLLPAYYLVGMAAALLAFWDYFVTPFHWRKTAHGLARGRAAQ
ncbi:MAG: glycosyltransferase [Hyphomicrobiales bacterium]|nr:glycosyltransferase [Hyphomicrobiales bacterium]MDE2113690.1 glycosyltransferase [Hyphomicrobiales bacterium]